MSRWLLCCLLTIGAIRPSWSVEYVSVADGAAILYEADNNHSRKLFVISRYTPLEVVINQQKWIKVRDSSGTLAWIERRSVSDRHFVVVSSPQAVVRKAPEMNATVLYQVAHHVVLESLGVNGGGWVKTRHLDGSVGYARSVDLWGVD